MRPPRPLRRHRHPMARAAGAAGAVLLIAGLLACKDGDSAPPAMAATTPASAALPASPFASATVPPPPDLRAPPTAAPPAASEAGQGSLADARAQLESALARGAHCSADTQCRSVATGAKACGGPTGYRAYSAAGVDPATVEALAQHERELSLAEARASGRVSNCLMLAAPGARCVNQRCVTSGSAAPDPATR